MLNSIELFRDVVAEIVAGLEVDSALGEFGRISAPGVLDKDLVVFYVDYRGGFDRNYSVAILIPASDDHAAVLELVRKKFDEAVAGLKAMLVADQVLTHA